MFLNVEDVFEQLRETQPLRNGRSRHYIGTEVKATGSLSRAKELADDLVALSIIPHSALGSVTTGVSFSEYREIARGDSDQDVTVEGQISFMSLDNSHELYLSDAKVYV
jgi:hypothetical protein